jgi:lantibiotic modifying enzyme
MNRRELLRASGAALLAACGSRSARTGGVSPGLRPQPRPDYLAHACQAAVYIRSLAVETPHGLLWRKSPDERSTDVDLYHGSAGPALFFLELFRATGDQSYLREAERGAAHIAATMPDKPQFWQTGLFGGFVGHGVLFLELARTTGDAPQVDAARRAFDRLEVSVKPLGAGALFEAGPDIYYGNAGAIVWLLQASSALGERAPVLAERLGDGILACAREANPGRRWMLDDIQGLAESKPGREMPNFSHGTSGVGFALARLYDATRAERFLAGALAAAEHLLAIAYTEGDVCLIPHVLPDGAARYYLGTCHGPAGTSRLFHELAVVTGNAKWGEWFRKCVNGVLYSGIPEARTPGFWDNVGQCCGSASVAEFMLSLHRLRGDHDYLELAHRLAADILARATPAAGGGLEWTHAENRIEPYWKQSYTGYMQGAAGIGSLFVRLSGHEQKADWKVRLPDNPFPV